MRLKRCLIGLLILACLLPTLTGCANRTKKYASEGFEYFDTFYLLTVYTNDEKTFRQYADLCRDTIKEYHQLLDIYHTYDGINNLKTVNDRAGETVTVEPRLYDFLTYAKEIYDKTQGYTNILMGSVTSLWHEKRAEANMGKEPSLPSSEAITEALAHTDIHTLLLSVDGSSVTLTDPESSLDAGALGKGYTAQKIAESLLAAGCENFLLNMGGNTVAYGTKPKGDAWLVGIQTPNGHEGYAPSVRLTDASLVTSGSYERNLTVDGKQYHHIVHPETGYPMDTYVGVSVLCRDSSLADALSTALFSMTPEDGMALIESLPEAEALWLCTDGSTFCSNGWKSHTEGATK